jgi:hypothetical protein
MPRTVTAAAFATSTLIVGGSTCWGMAVTAAPGTTPAAANAAANFV